MPLFIEGRRVRLPQSVRDIVRAHPPLERAFPAPPRRPRERFAAEGSHTIHQCVKGLESGAQLSQERAKLLRGQSVQLVGPEGLLYVQQRELAVTSPQDGSISILGSDDATTCHIVVLRHTGNGATCLTHCDGSDTQSEVPLIMKSLKSLSSHTHNGRLEVHLVGGFNDDRQLSQKLTNQLLSEFDRQEDDIHLVTFCVSELNDREENENHFPVICGIAINIKTAEIFRAAFPERGPEEELRSARSLTGGPVSGKSGIFFFYIKDFHLKIHFGCMRYTGVEDSKIYWITGNSRHLKLWKGENADVFSSLVKLWPGIRTLKKTHSEGSKRNIFTEEFLSL